MTDLDRGTEVVRTALAARSKASLNIATTAKDLGVAADTLVGFIEKRVALQPDVVAGLVKLLFMATRSGTLSMTSSRMLTASPPRRLG